MTPEQYLSHPGIAYNILIYLSPNNALIFGAINKANRKVVLGYHGQMSRDPFVFKIPLSFFLDLARPRSFKCFHCGLFKLSFKYIARNREILESFNVSEQRRQFVCFLCKRCQRDCDLIIAEVSLSLLRLRRGRSPLLSVDNNLRKCAIRLVQSQWDVLRRLHGTFTCSEVVELLCAFPNAYSV
jgi:hypothetical protein